MTLSTRRCRRPAGPRLKTLGQQLAPRWCRLPLARSSGRVSGQAAFADRLLLNKTDLVTEEDLLRIEARLRGINAFAPIQRCSRGDVSVDRVLNIRGFDLQRALQAR